MTDTEILALSYKDPAQFATIFERHSGRLLAIARKSLGSKEEAEDAVQETFVRVYKYGKKFLEQGGEFRPWMNAILKNCIVDQIRRRKTEEVSLSDEIMAVVPAVNDFRERESENYVQSLFSKLDKRAAEILNLRFVLGKSFKEIGRVLGISSAAARVRAHRAKKEFAELHKIELAYQKH